MTTSSSRSPPPALASYRGVRQPRADGSVTRAGIVETAGQLFAERGYADTTSKAICERAGVNMAAINYHFGSRDGLYLAVMKEVHQRIVSMAFLREAASSSLPPDEKLRVLLRELVGRILDASSWPTRVWAREVLAPSPLLSQIMQEEAQPKFETFSLVIGEISGIAPGDPRMASLVLSVIAPCLTMLVADRTVVTPIQSLFGLPADVLADHFWRFAMAGLRADGS